MEESQAEGFGVSDGLVIGLSIAVTGFFAYQAVRGFKRDYDQMADRIIALEARVESLENPPRSSPISPSS